MNCCTSASYSLPFPEKNVVKRFFMALVLMVSEQ